VLFGRSQGLIEALNAKTGELLWQVRRGRELSGLLSYLKRAIISGLEPTSRRGGPRPPARRRSASSHHRNPMRAAGLWPSRPMAQEALDHPVHRVGGPGHQLVEVAAQCPHPTRCLLPLS
jgi:hypothetical protein